MPENYYVTLGDLETDREFERRQLGYGPADAAAKAREAAGADRGIDVDRLEVVRVEAALFGGDREPVDFEW